MRVRRLPRIRVARRRRYELALASKKPSITIARERAEADQVVKRSWLSLPLSRSRPASLRSRRCGPLDEVARDQRLCWRRTRHHHRGEADDVVLEDGPQVPRELRVSLCSPARRRPTIAVVRLYAASTLEAGCRGQCGVDAAVGALARRREDRGRCCGCAPPVLAVELEARVIGGYRGGQFERDLVVGRRSTIDALGVEQKVALTTASSPWISKHNAKPLPVDEACGSWCDDC